MVDIAAGHRHYLRMSPNHGAHPPHRYQAAFTNPELGLYNLVKVQDTRPAREEHVQDIAG
jgi:hypothetical protein